MKTKIFTLWLLVCAITISDNAYSKSLQTVRYKDGSSCEGMVRGNKFTSGPMNLVLNDGTSFKGDYVLNYEKGKKGHFIGQIILSDSCTIAGVFKIANDSQGIKIIANSKKAVQWHVIGNIDEYRFCQNGTDVFVYRDSVIIKSSNGVKYQFNGTKYQFGNIFRGNFLWKNVSVLKDFRAPEIFTLFFNHKTPLDATITFASGNTYYGPVIMNFQSGNIMSVPAGSGGFAFSSGEIFNGRFYKNSFLPYKGSIHGGGMKYQEIDLGDSLSIAGVKPDGNVSFNDIYKIIVEEKRRKEARIAEEKRRQEARIAEEKQEKLAKEEAEKEREEQLRKESIRKYGTKYGTLVADKKLAQGMSKEMCNDVVNKKSYDILYSGDFEIWTYNPQKARLSQTKSLDDLLVIGLLDQLGFGALMDMVAYQRLVFRNGKLFEFSERTIR